ncbi:hypothetical protein DFQ28_004004 [Apophysomyces sp. BC1034]|nr:hypothetical protein DFQ30_005409 [Apophysomyces sp. BC1015]KAG0178839.1 hypothetical protein DFQ29_002907 [Apophysomyces sp. BC1021]KAG0189009.1 hypothetical protein DFQ28_004004 [Apophysomyces sp. BC1034]
MDSEQEPPLIAATEPITEKEDVAVECKTPDQEAQSPRSSAEAPLDQDHYSHFSNQLPPVMPSIRSKPKRSTNALHLLVQEASRSFILSDLCRKPADTQSALFKDRRKLANELKQYSTLDVLAGAKNKILSELKEEDREALADVSPENEIIKMRFEEHEAVSRSFEDAVAELRYEYDDKKEGDTSNNVQVFPAELPELFKLFDQLISRRHPRQDGHHKPRGGRFHSARHTPYYSNPSFRPRDSGGYSRGGPRDYRDRRDRDDYHRRRYDDWREFERRPPGPPLAHDDYKMRRDPGYGPPRAYDDRRRPPVDRPQQRDQRLPVPPQPMAGPPTYAAGPVKPSPTTYESAPQPPMPAAPQPPAADGNSYGYSYGDPNVASYSGMYDPNAKFYTQQDPNSIYRPYPSMPTYSQPPQPWAYGMPVQNQSFSSRDPGRHLSLPLPTDFMTGPSDAPRVSMPEPHQSLGVLKGVIIRDAQGNIGLASYTFSPFN